MLDYACVYMRKCNTVTITIPTCHDHSKSLRLSKLTRVTVHSSCMSSRFMKSTAAVPTALNYKKAETVYTVHQL